MIASSTSSAVSGRQRSRSSTNTHTFPSVARVASRSLKIRRNSCVDATRSGVSSPPRSSCSGLSFVSIPSSSFRRPSQGAKAPAATTEAFATASPTASGSSCAALAGWPMRSLNIPNRAASWSNFRRPSSRASPVASRRTSTSCFSPRPSDCRALVAAGTSGTASTSYSFRAISSSSARQISSAVLYCHALNESTGIVARRSPARPRYRRSRPACRGHCTVRSLSRSRPRHRRHLAPELFGIIALAWSAVASGACADCPPSAASVPRLRRSAEPTPAGHPGRAFPADMLRSSGAASGSPFPRHEA